jgi:hypothetical protein
VQRIFAPRFFKIRSLLPELRRIIFFSHDRERGSNTLDSTNTSEVDGRTFKEFAEDNYAMFLDRQLASRGMDGITPKIMFMEPVDVSAEQN